MQINNSRVVRIGTIAFALILFTAYVVYSQRQRIRPVSRPAVVSITTGQPIAAPATDVANPEPAPKSIMVAPGSKVRVPIVNVRESETEMIVASGSKSAPVFDRREQAQLRQFLQPIASPAALPSSVPTNSVVSRKFQSQPQSPTVINAHAP